MTDTDRPWLWLPFESDGKQDREWVELLTDEDVEHDMLTTLSGQAWQLLINQPDLKMRKWVVAYPESLQLYIHESLLEGGIPEWARTIAARKNQS